MEKAKLSLILVLVAASANIVIGAPQPPCALRNMALCEKASENEFVFLGTVAAGITQRSVYFRSTAITQWQGAVDDCRRIFGSSSTLVDVETPAEFEKLTEFMQDETSGTVYWTGGRYDSVKKSFVWQNRNPIGSWVPWDDGHPDSAFAITRMVYSPITARFQTIDNSKEHRYICEIVEKDPEPSSRPQHDAEQGWA